MTDTGMTEFGINEAAKFAVKRSSEALKPQEKLLGLVAKRAEEMARKDHLFSEKMGAFSNWAYDFATNMVANRLHGDPTHKLLNELDPEIIVFTIEPNGKIKNNLGLRAHTGVEPGEKVVYTEGLGENNPQTVIDTLEGRNPKYRVQISREGVLVPLRDAQGNLVVTKLTHAEARRIDTNWPIRSPAPEVIPASTALQYLGSKNLTAAEITQMPDRSGSPRTGFSSLESPHHKNQDGFYSDEFPKRSRVVVLDMSGGAFAGSNYSPEQQAALIEAKKKALLEPLAGLSHLPTNEALTEAEKTAVQKYPQNGAYGGEIIADVYGGRLDIAHKGDVAALLWNEQGFAHRRSDVWSGGNRGDSSNFQLLNKPDNLAYTLKDVGLGGKTGYIDQTPEANTIMSTVGTVESLDKLPTKHSFTNIPPGSYLLVCSDGARPSEMTDPSTEYYRLVSKQMEALKEGRLNESQVAANIAGVARKTLGDEDDITVAVVKLG